MYNKVFMVVRRIVATLWLYGILGEWAEDFMSATFDKAESLARHKDRR